MRMLRKGRAGGVEANLRTSHARGWCKHQIEGLEITSVGIRKKEKVNHGPGHGGDKV